MSLYDYLYSQKLAKDDPPFYGLMMALIRKADSINLRLLETYWPEIVQEFRKRYYAPGGIIPEDGEIDHKSIIQTKITLGI